MPVDPDLVAVAFLLTGGGLALLLREPLRHRDKPGSTGFAVAVVGISLWPLSLAVSYVLAGESASLAALAWNGRLFAAGLVSVGWFLLAFEFTRQRLPSRGALALLVGYLLVGQAVAWTNPLHHLVLAPSTTVAAGVLVPTYGAWFWVQAALNYGLILAATALLAVEWVGSENRRRRQAAILALAVVPPTATNLLTILGQVSTPHDLTPFGLVGSGIMLSWVLYRMELLEIVPVARATALEGMDDAVVVLNDADRVVDCNAAARDLFDVGEDYYGLAAGDLFPGPLADAYADENRGEVTFDVAGEPRHFSLSASAVVGPRGTDAGRVVVLRDVTERKRREEDLAAREAELDLLRQVLTRVLRHNLRNELTSIRGNAETLAGEGHDRARSIVDASERLIRLSEKTRAIERIVTDDDVRETYDLEAVATDAARAVARRYPDADVSVDAAGPCRVTTSPGLDVVVENLVENGVEHDPGAAPAVAVTVTRAADTCTLTVEDDGPGIPAEELAVLERGEETPLSHGSGIGLWLVEWWVERADATLTFDTGDDGTAVTLTVDRDQGR